VSLIILNENNYYSFRPGITAAEYTAWPTVAALASLQALQGLDEDRANALIDIDRPTREQRMRRFYDPSLEWNEFAEEKNGLTRISAGFDPQKVRAEALKRDKFLDSNIVRYVFRPNGYSMVLSHNDAEHLEAIKTRTRQAGAFR
jgi:hypothetical protein